MSEMPPQPGHPDLNPGDVAPPDAEDAGENLCPQCGGSGTDGDADCEVCGGTGKVIEGVGGG